MIASADETLTAAATVNGYLASSVLPRMLAEFLGVRSEFEGVQAVQRGAIVALRTAFTLPMLARSPC